MILKSLQFIESLGDNHESLSELCHTQVRKQNKKRFFKAPLMVSAHKLKHLNKIDELDCDAVIINLEDGVAQEQKAIALSYAKIFISHLEHSDKKIIVRINALDEGGRDEIQALLPYLPDAIRIPKIKTLKEVQELEMLIDASIDIHLSIETKEAWTLLNQLKTSSRVTHFYLGVLDLFADMKLSQSLIKRDNPTMLYILSHFLITCKSIGVEAVSFVFQEHHDMEGFKAWYVLEKEMGYEAKGVISPNQARFVMELENDAEAFHRAMHIIESFEAHKAQGVTGFVDDRYGFIDEPIYKGALIIKEQYGV